MPEDQALTVEEAAHRLGVSVATVRRWCASGALKAHKVGRQWVVDAAAVRGKARPRRAPRRSSAASHLDVDTALTHLRNRDLKIIESWVPDVLVYQDLLAEETTLKAHALERLQSEGPFDLPFEVDIPKNAFFTRAARLLTLEDRLAYHTAVLSLAPKIEGQRNASVYSACLSPDSRYLLSNGRDQWLAWQRRLRADVEAGYTWAIKTDLAAYFDNIQHSLLFAEINALNPDPQTARSLKRMLSEWTQNSGVGVPQGPDASRLLANHYLHTVDEAMMGGPWKYTRYMDDIRILARSKADSIRGLRILERECRNRGLILAAQKTQLLVGASAIEDTIDETLADAEYWFQLRHPQAASLLKKILRKAMKPEGNIAVRGVRFALHRLRALRDGSMLRSLMARLEDLAPVASIVAQYLIPFLERRPVEEGLGSYLSDPDRNMSIYLNCWIMAAMLERPSPLPKRWIDLARAVVQDKNYPSYYRAIAANVLARSHATADLQWIEAQIRTEFEPLMIRGYLTALARVGGLTRATVKYVANKFDDLETTANFLNGRSTLPSLVYEDRVVAIPAA